MEKNYQNDEFLRKRYERQKKIRKRRAKVLLTLFIILLLIAGAVLSVTVLFPIKTVTASGSNIYTSAQIVNECGVKTGENLILVSKSKVLNNLKAELPFVDKVEFKRSFPNTLKIKVYDAEEYTCYKVGKKYFSVSKNDWVLKAYKSRPKNLSLIICNGVECKVGQSVKFNDESLKELYLNIVKTINDCDLYVDYVDLTDKMAIETKVENRFIVNFGTTNDFEAKVRHLKSMIENIDQNATGTINLSMWSKQNPQGAFKKSKIK